MPTYSSLHISIALEDPWPCHQEGFRTSLACGFSGLKIVRVSSHNVYPTVLRKGTASLRHAAAGREWDFPKEGIALLEITAFKVVTFLCMEELA